MEYILLFLAFLFVIGISFYFIFKTQKRNKKNGMLTSYKVIYLGGAPNHLKRMGGVDLFIMPDRFIVDKIGDSFYPIEIPYDKVKKFEVVQRQMTAGESLVTGINKQNMMETKNHIHIDYFDNDIELTLRLEMFTGGALSATAVKCNELLDFLKINGIYQKFGI